MNVLSFKYIFSLLIMGNSNSTIYINFEDMQAGINNKEYIIINTLRENQQHCLINGTLSMGNEEDILNTYLKKYLKIKAEYQHEIDKGIYDWSDLKLHQLHLEADALAELIIRERNSSK